MNACIYGMTLPPRFCVYCPLTPSLQVFDFSAESLCSAGASLLEDLCSCFLILKEKCFLVHHISVVYLSEVCCDMPTGIFAVLQSGMTWFCPQCGMDFHTTATANPIVDELLPRERSDLPPCPENGSSCIKRSP